MEKEIIVLSPLDVQACKVFYELGKVGTSILYRKLKIPFEDAEKIIAKLIKAEIISPYKENDQPEIIMSLTAFWQLIGEKCTL